MRIIKRKQTQKTLYQMVLVKSRMQETEKDEDESLYNTTINEPIKILITRFLLTRLYICFASLGVD